MILDATAGGRQMWNQKYDPDTVYLDMRKTFPTQTPSGNIINGAFKIPPDIQAVWSYLPFRDNTFQMCIFDPPHRIRKFSPTWIHDSLYGVIEPAKFVKVFYEAFKELFRVLKPNGFLILKWCDLDRPLDDLLKLTDVKPLFWNISGATKKGEQKNYFVCFRKS
jgi:SAM-dependent methyltransferase